MHAAGNPFNGFALAALCALTLLGASPVRAQIAHVGVGAQVASDSAGSITPALPAGTAAGDLAVLFVAGRPSNTSEPAAPRCMSSAIAAS